MRSDAKSRTLRPVTRFVAALVTVTLLYSPTLTAQALNAKVQETLMGPTQSYSFPSWTTDSKHFAAMVWSGRGWTPMIDGKLGLSYDCMLDDNVVGVGFVTANIFRFYGVKAGQLYRVTLALGSAL